MPAIRKFQPIVNQNLLINQATFLFSARIKIETIQKTADSIAPRRPFARPDIHELVNEALCPKAVTLPATKMALSFVEKLGQAAAKNMYGLEAFDPECDIPSTVRAGIKIYDHSKLSYVGLKVSAPNPSGIQKLELMLELGLTHIRIAVPGSKPEYVEYAGDCIGVVMHLISELANQHQKDQSSI